MAVVLGKNIFIYAGNTGTTPIIAAAKSCAISGKCDLIEKASSTQQTSKEYLPGRDDYDISLDHLVTTGAPFEGLLKLRGTYTLSLVIGTTRKYCRAICAQADLHGAVGSLATGAIKFKVSGGLSDSPIT